MLRMPRILHTRDKCARKPQELIADAGTNPLTPLFNPFDFRDTRVPDRYMKMIGSTSTFEPFSLGERSVLTALIDRCAFPVVAASSHAYNSLGDSGGGEGHDFRLGGVDWAPAS
jgi:hypothetical protein